MYNYVYKTEQWLPVDIDTAWDFFSNPKNLARITPPYLRFKILTNLEGVEIYEGMLIDYTLKPLLGIPVHWQTEISSVQKPYSFTDKQLKGPYDYWEHTHTFIEKDNGILMKDEVRYRLPLHFVGGMAHKLFIGKRVENIFEFRRQVLQQIFNKHEQHHH